MCNVQVSAVDKRIEGWVAANPSVARMPPLPEPAQMPDFFPVRAAEKDFTVTAALADDIYSQAGTPIHAENDFTATAAQADDIFGQLGTNGTS